MPRQGKGSTKAERDALRQEMLVSGCSLELIATEMERRWGIRPREAYRHAHGWSQDEVAARFTEVADRIGGDRGPGPDGRPAPAQAPMIGTRIGEYERWPNGGRRPSPYVLTVLATVLGTTVERLLDYDDHRKMPDQERTVLAAVLAAASAPVPLPPEPRSGTTPSRRAPLGRLTELLTSADRPGSDPAGVDPLTAGTDQGAAGPAGTLTPEQWSAARRLVRRGFGPADDDPDAGDPPAGAGAGRSGQAGGAKKRAPARRPRSGGQGRAARPAEPTVQADLDDGAQPEAAGKSAGGPETAGRPRRDEYVEALKQLGAQRLPGVWDEGDAAGQAETAGSASGADSAVVDAGTPPLADVHADRVGPADGDGATGSDGATDDARIAGAGTAAPSAESPDTTTGDVDTAGEIGKAGQAGQADQAGTTDEADPADQADTTDQAGLAPQVDVADATGAAGQAGSTAQIPASDEDGGTDRAGATDQAGGSGRPGAVGQVGPSSKVDAAGRGGTTEPAEPGSEERSDRTGQPDADGRTDSSGRADGDGRTDASGRADGDGRDDASGRADSSGRTVAGERLDADGSPGAPGRAGGAGQYSVAEREALWQRARRTPDTHGGAVILPFSPDGPDGPEAGPADSGSRRPDDASRTHDQPPDQVGWDVPPGDPYRPPRLQQRVPRPVPPPLPDPPYIAVTLDPTSPDAAAAARRHRRDRLLATGPDGTGVRSDEEVIMDAAGQSAEFSEWAEGTNVGSTTLEQLDEDVRRISRDYLGHPPLPLLLSALRVRNRVFTLLEGRQHPEQSRHLYLTAGRLCGLLGWMASDVGRHGEAETQARTAWLCAELAGSDGLRAWVRATQSKIAYWDGRIQESAGLASDGLRFAAPDSARVLLASLSARAWARLGRPDEAHSALHVAEEERSRAGEDEVGGLLAFSEAQQSYMAGSTHLWLREPKEALAASDRAIWLFDVGNQSTRFYGAEMLALVDAAAALVQSGDLDGAAERLRPILELPPEQQLDTFTSRLGELRDSLRRSRYAASRPAVDIQRQIEEFRAGALGQILGR